MAADKFLNLKYLRIHLTGFSKAFCPDYDYLSLVSFLDASPTLETFILSVSCSSCNSIFFLEKKKAFISVVNLK